MSDARWSEIAAAVACAVRHFSGAVAFYPTLPTAQDRYIAEMAFLHAMLAGQTSLEAVLLRILDLFKQQAPRCCRRQIELFARTTSPWSGRREGERR